MDHSQRVALHDTTLVPIFIITLMVVRTMEKSPSEHVMILKKI